MSQRPDVATRGRKAGMGSHQSAASDTVEWYTPPGLFDALGLRFDLDPCAPPGGLPWIPADRFFSVDDDGLTQPWQGRVWLNPPYGRHTRGWVRRLAAHGDGVALVFARTETEWAQDVLPACSAVCFIRGRLTFVRADLEPGSFNAGAPSMLLAFGEECAAAVAAAELGITFAVTAPALAGQGGLWEGVTA